MKILLHLVALDAIRSYRPGKLTIGVTSEAMKSTLCLPGGGTPIAIECKWSASDFDPSSVKAFRRQYRQGKTFVVANDVDRSYRRLYNNIEISFVNLPGLIQALEGD